ncbi:hypothetical protein [Flavobacterium ginsengiterrae]|uniref:Uncharacterized protein n=1 Tax=Flavobacterium ginsengiterrae TaxID=871695 RepID=A0ABP7H3G4_9FLAO
MSYTIKKEEVIQYNPDELKSFNLYIYEWIDNLHFALDPKLFLNNAEEYITEAKKLFKKAGWHGDGEIQLIWIPPFMYSDYGFGELSKGFVIWHVKQESDGISWILSPDKIPFCENS